MDKVFAPIDDLIANIGKLILIKPRLSGLVVAILLIVTIIIVSSINTHSTDSQITPSGLTDTIHHINHAGKQPFPPTLNTAINQANPLDNTAATHQNKWLDVRVRSGDNLSHIFSRLHLSAQQLHSITVLGKFSRSFKKLSPGQILQFSIVTNELHALAYPLHGKQKLIVVRTAHGFRAYHSTHLPALPQSQSVKTRASAPINQPVMTHNTSTQINEDRWMTIVIKRHDTLGSIFHREHLSTNDLYAILRNIPKLVLKKFKPGQIIYIQTDAHHNIQQFQYNFGNDQTFTLTRTNSGFTASKQTAIVQAHKNAPIKPSAVNTKNTISSHTQPLFVPTADISIPAKQLPEIFGTVHRSLYRSALNAGLPHKQALELTDLFNQDGTVGKNIRTGDRFSVLYQDKGGNSEIMAAELIHKDKPYQLVRFKDPAGNSHFYTQDGISLNPPIERAPLKYTYISSYFSGRRWHPILHFYRPHEGIDYAAPEGTVVHAASNGKVVFLGRRGGYGNTLVIKHDNQYSTLYAHLSRYVSGLHDGVTVKQGEVVAYVGHTGLATGAHLHFEIHVNNVPKNPLNVALPTGTKIPNNYRQQFFASTHPLITQLSMTNHVLLAQKNESAHKS